MSISGTQMERAEDQRLSPDSAPSLGAILAARLGRRAVLASGLAVALAPMLPGEGKAQTSQVSGVPAGVSPDGVVLDGHQTRVLLAWGDPIFPDSPAFRPGMADAEAAAAQERLFGYNCDHIKLLPDRPGQPITDRAILAVNHEYTEAPMMFPGIEVSDKGFGWLTPAMMAVEQAAHGVSLVEIRRMAEGWQVDRDGRRNRRITARTPMRLSGPAAGHALLRTSADAEGRSVLGTLNNCGGGMTPWGTYLTAEENFNGYFLGKPAEDAAGKALKRYGVGAGWYGWGRHEARFDLAQEPNESHRFGWIVEIDPQDPAAPPVKRTALGRFKNEGAETVLAPDGRLVVFMGDDQRFDYVYRFVSDRVVDLQDLAANRDLLDAGTLSVARFDAEGGVAWLPLIHGQGPLTAENGFPDQATVLIHARLAADLLGATPMDRPEDVEPDPATGQVHVILTKNERRTADQVDAANPRAENLFGHVLTLQAPDGDFAADRFTWAILLQGEKETLACPDNAALDPAGRLWIATDQGDDWGRTGSADGLFRVGPEGALTRLYRAPAGAELTGPCFAPDGESLFLSVQHPGADGGEHLAGFARRSRFEDPMTRWPDFSDALPPRPAVIVITKQAGGPVG